MPDYRRALAEFERRFGPGGVAGMARAPYRVCPLGAHTDHQRGLVLGFTIDAEVRVFFRARGDRQVRAGSREYPKEAVEFAIGDGPSGEPGYGDYLRGVARALDLHHRVSSGADVWIEGDLAPGGIASSAALEVAFLLALTHSNGLRLERAAAMRMIVDAETWGAGVHVGLLDPAVILFGQVDHVVSLDCDEGAPRAQKLAAALPRFDFVIASTGAGRALRDSPYNARVEECRDAARALGATGEPPVLREVTLEQLRRSRGKLDPTLARRAEHVLSENKRVKNGLAALQQGDIESFGALVNASGKSMIRLFDAGTPETARLVTMLQKDRDVIGATLNGAGFGGSVLAIVKKGSGWTVFERVDAAMPPQAGEGGAPLSWVVSQTGPGPSVSSL